MSWLPDNDPVLGDIHSCDALELVIVPRVREYLAHEYKIDEPGVMKWGQHWHLEALKALEANLAGSPQTGRYCQGDAITIADICLAGQAAGSTYFKVDIAPFPTVKRIVDLCMQNDAFARAHPMKQPGAPRLVGQDFGESGARFRRADPFRARRHARTRDRGRFRRRA